MQRYVYGASRVRQRIPEPRAYILRASAYLSGLGLSPRSTLVIYHIKEDREIVRRIVIPPKTDKLPARHVQGRNRHADRRLTTGERRRGGNGIPDRLRLCPAADQDHTDQQEQDYYRGALFQFRIPA